ncbi:unnamed protein product [Caretta caretta]
MHFTTSHNIMTTTGYCKSRFAATAMPSYSPTSKRLRTTPLELPGEKIEEISSWRANNFVKDIEPDSGWSWHGNTKKSTCSNRPLQVSSVFRMKLCAWTG